MVLQKKREPIDSKEETTDESRVRLHALQRLREPDTVIRERTYSQQKVQEDSE